MAGWVSEPQCCLSASNLSRERRCCGVLTTQLYHKGPLEGSSQAEVQLLIVSQQRLVDSVVTPEREETSGGWSDGGLSRTFPPQGPRIHAVCHVYPFLLSPGYHASLRNPLALLAGWSGLLS